ncbi:hypothetical protein BQ8794_220169 [Mesorhizobium prunaredense]|uniref:Uncharacterized protein n=1 Tax=Mesorhizobium prunaredense TaxID=1631249 RepID=A0A1R3V6S8_9HYPH|nr:hypothetical protein BQ8794_220169 [Mesorhizobium prunaredense]
MLDLAHAKARSATDELNKGREAAAATADIIHWRRSNA